MLTLSAYPSESVEQEPGTLSTGLVEPSPDEISGELLPSSIINKDLPSLGNNLPLRLVPEHPMGRRSNDCPDNLSDYNTAAGAVHAKKSLPPLSTKSSVHMWLVPLSTLIAIAALTAWLVSKNDKAFTSLAGSEIGGHLTQAQAKGVDFVCSALLAPLLFAGLNLLWFACARVCVINESARSVPLQTLATASVMSRGTYDPLQLYALLRGRTWRLAALGGIALCSAMGSSALSVSIIFQFDHI